jgi:uncharacterized phage protein gp47/JayE
MADLPNFQDLFRTGRDEALSRNNRLTLEEIERKGSDLNILVAASAAMSDDVMGQLAQLKADTFAGTARFDALDRLILDRYPGLVRKQASPSFGYVTFSFLPAVTSAFSIPDGTQLSTADGVQFITVGAVSVAIGTTSIAVPVRSVLAGAQQKAKPGAINSLLAQIVGAPSSGMTVSNTAATFGGEDRESDTDYVTRSRTYFLSQRRATKSAIEQAVLSIPGVRKCTVFENLDTLGRPIGYVQIVVADSYTEQFVTASTLPATYATQLANLAVQIETVLEDWRSAGVGVQVVFATVVLQSIRVSLAYLPGVDQESVKTVVLARIIQHVNGLKPGEALNISELRNLAQTTSGVYATGNEIVTPTGNVMPRPGEVLRTSTTFTQVT